MIKTNKHFIKIDKNTSDQHWMHWMICMNNRLCGSNTVYCHADHSSLC